MNWAKQQNLILILLLWLLSGCQNATERVVPQVDEVTEVAIAAKATNIATATATIRPPSPTLTHSPTITIEPTKTHTPTKVPPTKVPPTEVPPTEVPPTEVPPTEVPPATEVPPTEVPPTEVPPTEVPPTEVPPTEVPPATEVPATELPRTEVPATELPATEVPATELPPTEVPPTEVLPTEVPPTEVPAIEVPTIEIVPTEVPPTVIPATQVPPTPPVISSSATGTQPVLLMIPRLGVNAGVESVGQTASGAMDVPHNVQSVGWYNLGVRPGEMGNAVLSGHFDDYKQDPAVFWRLHELVVGDLVMIRDAQGREHEYEVIGQEIYPFNQAPLNRIFGLTTSHNLNLITCNGTWDENAWNYDKRLVVYTRKVTN